MVSCRSQPLAERYRTSCITSLVLDAIFALVYGNTALEAMSLSPKTADCYLAEGYNWHMVLTSLLLLATFVAVAGVAVHAEGVCCPPIGEARLRLAVRYALALSLWTCVSSVLEAVVHQQPRPHCSTEELGEAHVDAVVEEESHQHDGPTRRFAEQLWQAFYLLLWVAWFFSCVHTAVLARRCLTSPDALAQLSGRIYDIHSSGMVHTIGTPVELTDRVDAIPIGVDGAAPRQVGLALDGQGGISPGFPVQDETTNANPTASS
eukprot:TRINITY_DN93046_c0_g1_i1.p1 TRINITY_DN93046_c0_g1~~TRINITY_DN93046_c0_g1_i1.p1  ORF type:complete len:263 (+),score=27.59 TRINITY_DN93046_c0_g1_i1:105-893(+)